MSTVQIHSSSTSNPKRSHRAIEDCRATHTDLAKALHELNRLHAA